MGEHDKELWRQIKHPGDIVKIFCEVDPEGIVPKGELRDLYWFSLEAIDYPIGHSPTTLEERKNEIEWWRMYKLGGSQKVMTITLRKYFKENNLDVIEKRYTTKRFFQKIGVYEEGMDMTKYGKGLGCWEGLSLRDWHDLESFEQLIRDHLAKGIT